MTRQQMLDSYRKLVIAKQRYYVKGLTDQAIGREMNLTGARVNQIRLGYVRSLTNQAS